MWAINGRWILPEMPDFHVTFRDLLHAVNGTNDFTSPPKEGVLRIFSPWKIRRLRPGLNPLIWVPKASTLPLDHRSRLHHAYVCYSSSVQCNIHQELFPRRGHRVKVTAYLNGRYWRSASRGLNSDFGTAVSLHEYSEYCCRLHYVEWNMMVTYIEY